MLHRINYCPYQDEVTHGETTINILWAEKDYIDFFKSVDLRKRILGFPKGPWSHEPCIAYKLTCSKCGTNTHLSNLFEQDGVYSQGFHQDLQKMLIDDYLRGTLNIVYRQEFNK